MSIESNYLYDYFPATTKLKGFISIPHSGEWIPEEFKKYLISDSKALNVDVDYRVHDLIDIERLNSLGIAVIVAKIHRACIDLNRSEDVTVLNWKQNTHGVELVHTNPENAFIIESISKYHKPYYDALALLIDLTKQSVATPVPMIDLHSMPSSPTAYHLKLNPNQKTTRADFCISDLIGKSCRPDFIDFVSGLLSKDGYDAVKNDPYFGGNVTKFINSIEGTDNIQIEINRSIYMDEIERKLIDDKVSKLKPILTEAFEKTFLRYARDL